LFSDSLLHRETFQQPAGDDEPLDLVRAFAHGEELGVAEVALNGQLLGRWTLLLENPV
jgi:hypothetical protein